VIVSLIIASVHGAMAKLLHKKLKILPHYTPLNLGCKYFLL